MLGLVQRGFPYVLNIHLQRFGLPGGLAPSTFRQFGSGPKSFVHENSEKASTFREINFRSDRNHLYTKFTLI